MDIKSTIYIILYPSGWQRNFLKFDDVKVLCKQVQVATHFTCQALLSSFSWETFKGQEQVPWSTSQQSRRAQLWGLRKQLRSLGYDAFMQRD